MPAARAAFHALLSNDPTLAALGVGAVYVTNAVDTPAEECFLVLRWDAATPSYKLRGRDRVQVWVHDRRRDYGRIDAVTRRIRELATNTVHLAGPDGGVMTLAEWAGEGPDLYDPGYETLTRYLDLVVVARWAD